MKKEKFEMLVQSVREGRSILKGEAKPSRSFDIGRQDVRRIREKLDVSQATFASLMGVSVNTVQNWEQGRRTPTGPARALLNVVCHKPGILSEPWFVEKGRHGAHASSLALG